MPTPVESEPGSPQGLPKTPVCAPRPPELPRPSPISEVMRPPVLPSKAPPEGRGRRPGLPPLRLAAGAAGTTIQLPRLAAVASEAAFRYLPRRDGAVGMHAMPRRTQRLQGRCMSHFTLASRQALHVAL